MMWMVLGSLGQKPWGWDRQGGFCCLATQSFLQRKEGAGLAWRDHLQILSVSLSQVSQTQGSSQATLPGADGLPSSPSNQHIPLSVQ